MNNATAIIQARLGSSRLPGKTLMRIEGESLLGHLLSRIKASRFVKNVIIATTTKENDDKIVGFARENGIEFYRGSEEDVLDRFYKTAKQYNVETIVRVTPDCPLLDPRVTDLVISNYLDGNYDYVSNTIRPTYPDGLDTEIFSYQALEKTWREAKLPSEREHVTSYMIKHPDTFRLFNVEKEGEDLSWMRWTVDTEKDLQFVKRIFDELYTTKEIFHMENIVSLLKIKPEILKINKTISRNEGYQLSLLEDGKVVGD